jgi:hypothetical protein
MKVLGTVPVKQFLYDELAELVLPFSPLLQSENEEVELPSDPRFQISQSIEGFVKRMAQVRPEMPYAAANNEAEVI